MTWLIVLAAFMAIFGVVGYLRGWRAALFVLILTMLAVAITGRLGDVIIRYINAFGKGFRFLLWNGRPHGRRWRRRGPAVAAGRLRSLKAQTNPWCLGLRLRHRGPRALLLSGIPYFKGKRSVLGLFLGLAAGYIVTGMIIRAVTPELSALVPLPFGFLPPVAVGALAVQPGPAARRCPRVS